MSQRISWKTSIASGPAALYNLAGIPSFPGAPLEFIWWMAFLISMTDGWWSNSSTVVCWGICSRAVALTDEGLFSKLLKCSVHCSLNASWCLISIDPSADSKGVSPDYVGPYTAFRALKNCWELFESVYFCTSSALLPHQWSFILHSPFWACPLRYLNFLPWIWSLGHFTTPHRPGSWHVAAECYTHHSHQTNPDVHIS